MAYTISATTKGGRNGRAILENGGLALAMGLQKEFGGNGEGHNPEQLFVLGWSDRKSTRLNSSHIQKSRMPSSA